MVWAFKPPEVQFFWHSGWSHDLIYGKLGKEGIFEVRKWDNWVGKTQVHSNTSCNKKAWPLSPEKTWIQNTFKLDAPWSRRDPSDLSNIKKKNTFLSNVLFQHQQLLHQHWSLDQNWDLIYLQNMSLKSEPYSASMTGSHINFKILNSASMSCPKLKSMYKWSIY